MSWFWTHPAVVWASFAGIALIAELFGTSYFFLCLAAAAALTALLTWVFILPFTFQLGVFSALALTTLYFWWRYLFKPITVKDNGLNNRTGQQVGQTAFILEDMQFNQGRININGSIWTVTANDNYSAGTKVCITKTDGLIFTVEALDDTVPQ